MRARLPGSFDALREREFRLLFSAHAISVFGDWLVPVAIAFAVLDLTGSASDLGFVIAARLVPMVVFMLAGGVWADRVPRQLLMIASSLVALVSEATLGVLLVMGTARIWEIVVLQAVRGTTAAFFRPASTGIVPDIVSPQRLQQANALMWGAFGIAGFAGPAVAGVFLATVGGGWAILGDAATFGVAAWLLSRMRLPVREVSRRQSFLRKLARRRGRSSPRPSGSAPSSATSPRSISTPSGRSSSPTSSAWRARRASSCSDLRLRPLRSRPPSSSPASASASRASSTRRRSNSRSLAKRSDGSRRGTGWDRRHCVRSGSRSPGLWPPRSGPVRCSSAGPQSPLRASCASSPCRRSGRCAQEGPARRPWSRRSSARSRYPRIRLSRCSASRAGRS
ncbi:MAG: MFS transporter [Actinobacteria bacterium]|nr:MAG: MFS transporter [Actinomycetota bacterium]